MNIITEDLLWLNRLKLNWKMPLDNSNKSKLDWKSLELKEFVRVDCSWKDCYKIKILTPILWFGKLSVHGVHEYVDNNKEWEIILTHDGNKEKVMHMNGSKIDAMDIAENLYHRYNNAFAIGFAWYGSYLVERIDKRTFFITNPYIGEKYYDCPIMDWKESIERIHQSKIEELLSQDNLLSNKIVERWYYPD